MNSDQPRKCDNGSVLERMRRAERLWLFLDYDGTLADFAPTPEHVEAHDDVVTLVRRLSTRPNTRVSIVSGRRLSHVRQLVPVPGLVLAGTYGVELQLPDGTRWDPVPFEIIRPTLDEIKPQWSKLLEDRAGFFLEDKGWALALHARFAGQEEANQVLAAGRQIAQEASERAQPGLFRLLGGHKFLEIGPARAHKGQTVHFLLEEHAWPGALPVYVGDDDKDEEAFAVIHDHHGLAIAVLHRPRPTAADCWLESPQAVRVWLSQLLNNPS